MSCINDRYYNLLKYESWSVISFIMQINIRYSNKVVFNFIIFIYLSAEILIKVY